MRAALFVMLVVELAHAGRASEFEEWRIAKPREVIELWGHIDNVVIDLTSGPSRTRATITFLASTRHRSASELYLYLRFPQDSHVNGLTVTIGGRRMVGRLHDGSHAREVYEKSVFEYLRYRDISWTRGPALLEPLPPSSRYDPPPWEHYSLRLFPVRSGQPVQVELDLTMPRDIELELRRARQPFTSVTVVRDGEIATWSSVAEPLHFTFDGTRRPMLATRELPYVHPEDALLVVP